MRTWLNWVLKILTSVLVFVVGAEMLYLMNMRVLWLVINETILLIFCAFTPFIPTSFIKKAFYLIGATIECMFNTFKLWFFDTNHDNRG